MQFVTSGNRIAVENFTVGYLYTITFTGGEYIHCACTGIGMDFVMFSRTAPEYTFALTMETAEGVSSIDLYSEGGGTMNYNDLTNKPQINGVELTGNKTSSDIGIQPLITADNKLSYTLVSGLGTAATTASSDYATAAQGALADSAVQPADMNSALNTKQNLINSDNMLSADLVDDTSSTNKFATAAELQQIETNKTNISMANAELIELVDSGAKNKIFVDKLNTTNANGVTYTINSDGTITVNGTPSGTSPSYVVVALPDGGTYKNFAEYCNGDNVLSGCPSGGGNGIYRMYITGTGYVKEDFGNGVELTDTSVTPVYLIIYIYNGYTANNLKFKPMICTKAAWDISQTYQPYRPNYQELYERVVALEQANQ